MSHYCCAQVFFSLRVSPFLGSSESKIEFVPSEEDKLFFFFSKIVNFILSSSRWSHLSNQDLLQFVLPGVPLNFRTLWK